jgi:hypothetical protein
MRVSRDLPASSTLFTQERQIYCRPLALRYRSSRPLQHELLDRRDRLLLLQYQLRL